MNKEIYQQYAKIKNQIKALEAEAKELEPQIVEDMGEEKSISTTIGSFYITKRKSWTYSQALNELASGLRIKQIMEQSNGTAKSKESQSLIFKAVKAK